MGRYGKLGRLSLTWVLPSDNRPVRQRVAWWCRDHFGEVGERWTLRGYTIFFYREEDLAFFLLRWGG